MAYLISSFDYAQDKLKSEFQRLCEQVSLRFGFTKGELASSV
jgi:hypothetical protein